MYHSSHAGLSAESGRFPRNLLSFADGRTSNGASVCQKESSNCLFLVVAAVAPLLLPLLPEQPTLLGHDLNACSISLARTASRLSKARAHERAWHAVRS